MGRPRYPKEGVALISRLIFNCLANPLPRNSLIKKDRLTKRKLVYHIHTYIYIERVIRSGSKRVKQEEGGEGGKEEGRGEGRRGEGERRGGREEEREEGRGERRGGRRGEAS